MAVELQIGARQVGRVTILDLQGDLTMFAEAAVTQAYHQAVEAGAHDLVLSFARVDYINSAGIAIIVSLVTEARAAGVVLAISRLSPHYQKIFRMVGLTQYADVFDTEDAAVADLQSRAAGSI